MIEDILLEKLTSAAGAPSPAARRALSAREAAQLPPEGPQRWLTELDANIRTMEQTRQNFAFRPIHSCKRVIGGLIVFAKRAVRKLLKWYIDPVCFQQTDFNNAVTPSIGRLTELSRYLLENVEQMKSMLALSAERIRALEADMDCIRAADGPVLKTESRGFFDQSTASQSGEDSIVAYIFMTLGCPAKDVTYLDLGANHARETSSTCYFYRQGARGVLVQANPDLIPELKRCRSGDTVLNRCVSDTDGGTVDFCLMSGGGLLSRSGESAERADERQPAPETTRTVQVETVSPGYILENYFSAPPKLLTIDMEGGNLAVLSAWDFEKYRPLVIAARTVPNGAGLTSGKKERETVELLTGKGYVEYAFTGIHSIFIDKRQAGGREQG